MVEINETHDPALKSWVSGANEAGIDFPIQNLPFGMYRLKGETGEFKACTAIGSYILDLAAVGYNYVGSLNELADAGNTVWHALRAKLSKALSLDSATEKEQYSQYLHAIDEVEMGLPVKCGDYTDYFTSYYHAYNAGMLFRPDAPLTPNFKWMPIAYHGRASTMVLTGTDIVRPKGQTMHAGAEPKLTASAWLDYEVELAVIVGPGNKIGEPIDIVDAESHIFGITVLNDWSARDIQAWEYQPLGPFLAKNFASTLSPWVVTMEALAPYRAAPFKRFEGDPEPLDYLTSAENAKFGGIDIIVRAAISRDNNDYAQVSQASYSSSYWNPAQMVTHHTISGCSLNAGDILGTGTISGEKPEEAGSLLELTKAGKTPVALNNQQECTFLEDGDVVKISAHCQAENFNSIGFGHAVGKIKPAC